MYVCTSGTPYLDTVIMHGNMFVVSYIGKNGTVTSVMYVKSHSRTRYILLMHSMSAAGLLALHLNILYYLSITIQICFSCTFYTASNPIRCWFTFSSFWLANILFHDMTLNLLRNTHVKYKEKERATLFNAKRKLPCFVPMLRSKTHLI